MTGLNPTINLYLPPDDIIKWKHFHITGLLCGEFTGHWWIPRTKASDEELWCFFDLRLNKRLSKQLWGWWFLLYIFYFIKRYFLRGSSRPGMCIHYTFGPTIRMPTMNLVIFVAINCDNTIFWPFMSSVWSCNEHVTIEYHIYIWQVSQQISCSENFQILMWFDGCNRYFCKKRSLVETLTHLPLVLHLWISELSQHWFR